MIVIRNPYYLSIINTNGESGDGLNRTRVIDTMILDHSYRLMNISLSAPAGSREPKTDPVNRK